MCIRDSLYPFELVIVAVAFIAWFVMYKTRFGMHLRACGDNPHAVDAAGRQVGQIRLAAIMILSLIHIYIRSSVIMHRLPDMVHRRTLCSS